MTRMRPLLRAFLPLVVVAAQAGAQQQPPRRLDFSTDTLPAPQEVDTVVPRLSQPTTREMRTTFVRNQTILGLGVYAPAFAAMVSEKPATRIASYMVMAGGTFFAANELAQLMEITPARQLLSTRMAIRGAGAGLALAVETDMVGSETGASALIGGLGGTAVGLAVGGGLTEGEAQAMVVGHDIVAASALAITYITHPSDGDGAGRELSPSTRVLVPMVAGWGGYALGRLYAGRATYEVTAGDALLLWLGAGIGATASGTFIAESDPSTATIAGTVLAGGLIGVWGADRLLVKRFDHSRGDGAFVALGGGAGALMGIGIGVLASGEVERGSSATFALGALGAAAGVWLTERYAQPPRDQGRRYDLGRAETRSDRVQFNPVSALAAASGAPGLHPILRLTF